MVHNASATTVDPAEVERFGRIADEWWDPRGKFAPLHRLGPVRVGYVRDHAARHFGRDPLGADPLAGLSVLDVGCGGGLMCEPMARLGGAVTGIDASARNVAVAGLHARGQGLAIDYRSGEAESMAAAGAQFDIVLALEIVEHVADVDLFLRSVGQVVRPGGIVFVSTLNRTAKAWALAVAGAEYVLRWLPRGTHDWRRFLKPSELSRGLRAGGIEVRGLTGIVYHPLSRRWSLNADDLDVNYILHGVRTA